MKAAFTLFDILGEKNKISNFIKYLRQFALRNKYNDVSFLKV